MAERVSEVVDFCLGSSATSGRWVTEAIMHVLYEINGYMPEVLVETKTSVTSVSFVESKE